MCEVKLIAVTGGIGAGKSTVVRRLGSHGAKIISADATARRVVDPDTARGRSLLDQVTALLGQDARRADGSLDRERVAALVFQDSTLRERYNAVIHPAIMAATADEIDALRSSEEVVLHEIPLLSADTPPLPWTYDLVVTVEADREERIHRLQQFRGYSAEQAAARISAQGAEERRTAVADVVLRTDGSLTRTERLVDELWDRLRG